MTVLSPRYLLYLTMLASELSLYRLLDSEMSVSRSNRHPSEQVVPPGADPQRAIRRQPLHLHPLRRRGEAYFAEEACRQPHDGLPRGQRDHGSAHGERLQGRHSAAEGKGVEDDVCSAQQVEKVIVGQRREEANA